MFADQVWAKAGMNPSVYISGDVIIHGEMSKRCVCIATWPKKVASAVPESASDLGNVGDRNPPGRPHKWRSKRKRLYPHDVSPGLARSAS